MQEQAIPVLGVRNAASAAAWYARLGFQQEWEHRFEPGLPAFVSIARGSVRLFLSEHAGDARPGSVYIRVADVASIAKDFHTEVREQDWGADETELEDPDGNRLRIGTPRT